MRRLLPAGVPGRLAVAALALAVVVAGGVYLAWPRPTSAPPSAETPARPSVPLLVSAGMPGRGAATSAVAGEEVVVTAHALADGPITALELWDGDERVATTEATNDAPALHARWAWSSGTAGEHVLLVRAVDGGGSVVQSDALRVSVSEAPVGLLSRNALAVQGAAPAYALALPAVQAEVSDCQLSLTVNDREASGFAVLGLAPGSGSFATIATMSAQDGEAKLLAPMPAGPTVLAVTAFTADAEVYAAPALLAAPDSCGTDDWTGALRLSNGRLTPAPGVDRAYLYLTVDGGAARRVPADPGTFVFPSAGELDFSPYLPALSATSIELEAWGWVGGQLLKLGAGAWQAPSAPSPGSPAGSAGGSASTAGGSWFQAGSPVAPVLTSLYAVRTTTIGGGPCGKEFCPFEELLLSDTISRPPAGSTAPAKKVLRWSTLMNDVTHLVWQITPYPPSGTANLDPPFLVDQFTTPVAVGVTGGDYTIDFKPYLTAGTATAGIGNAGGQSVKAIANLFQGSGQPAASPTPKPSSGGGAGGLAVATSLVSGSPIGYGSRFYVRVIPVRASGLGPPSGYVSFDVTDPPPQLQLAPSTGEGVHEGSYDISFDVTLPKAADPKYARCAIVTGITSQYVSSLVVDYKAHLASGQPLCYKPPSDDGWDLFDAFDAFVEFVADVWDTLVDASDWIKAQVVSVVLAAVPCKQIANDDICKQIANTALDVALASFGVPPSLPNFEEVVAAAKGDLATLIVTAAGNLPGVEAACGLADTASGVTDKVKNCQDLAKAAIDEAVDQMIKVRSDAAGQASGYAWPGVVFRPDPRGQYQPPSVTFTVKRTADPVLPSKCSVAASIGSVVDNWKWPELVYSKNLGSMVPSSASGTVKGSPFLPAGAPIPALEPGQTFTRQVWLTQPAQGWTESQAAWKYWYYYEALNNPNRAWVLLQSGAKLTYQLSGNCTPTVSQSFVLTQSGSNS